MERLEREAKESIPKGYGVVFDGEIQPDDLVYSWTTKEWLASDSPLWLQAPLRFVEDAVCVVRTGRPNVTAAGGVRRYTIRREPDPKQEFEGGLF